MENEKKDANEKKNGNENEPIRSEHRAIVFKMNRKQAASVARYIKAHEGAGELIFAVDVDTLELIVQAKNAREDDILLLEGEEDVFDVEEEIIEENEEVLIESH